MACCKCCCGGEDCAEGQEGKCCCGGPTGACCQAGEYCCSGACEPDPCGESGCCCTYEAVGGTWSLVGSEDSLEGDCVAGAGQIVVFRPGVNCSDTPDPCVGVVGGTCCDQYGGCLRGGPGIGCYPSNTPNECYCDSLCYTSCFDCCGDDAPECCTPSPEIASLWDDPPSDGLVRISLASLARDMAEYAIDQDEAWGAAMQCGSGVDGLFVMQNFGRVSLVLCLQDLEDGVAPWKAVLAHQDRVRSAGAALRVAPQ